MKVFVTGAGGYIGSAVCEALGRAGHEVTGLVRSERAAEPLRRGGLRPLVGDMRDPALLAHAAGEADAVIHAAQDRTDPAGVDEALVDAVVDALAGTERPFVYTSGVWVLGDAEEPTGEDAPLRPSPIVAWRPAVEDRVLQGASRGIRAIVLRPAVVFGRGGGIPALFRRWIREHGVARVPGEGLNRWRWVHVDDLADLYRLLLEVPEARGVFHAAHGPSPTVLEAVSALARGAGGLPVEGWPLDQARQALGPFADALALHQPGITAARALELGWKPRGPELLRTLEEEGALPA